MQHERVTRPLGILHAAEAARRERMTSACTLLPANAARDLLTQIVVGPEQRVALARFDRLLVRVADAIKHHKAQRCIADWPFEHFWHDLGEPRHTKLLKYFIDPDEDHDCGTFLLRSLLDVLDLKDLPIDECKVEREVRTIAGDFCGSIDILITRNCPERQYAVIIENKIHGAGDTDRQLQKYVHWLWHECGYREIYVFYLPLRYKKPSPNSLGDIRSMVRRCDVITFDKHIRNWIETVLRAGDELPEEMRDNLKHYLSLVRYLLKREILQMRNSEILEQIQKADAEGGLTWQYIEELAQAAQTLKDCYASALRARLLFGIQALLSANGLAARFYAQDGLAEEDVKSPYDERFVGEMNLGIRVNDVLLVCVGANANVKDGLVWTGYMKSGNEGDQDKFRAFVLKTPSSPFEGVHQNAPWYCWEWEKGICYDNCLDHATRLAGKLVEMYRAMRDKSLSYENATR